ncbi:U1 small nuclear ribonucleoprotein C [Ostreococcus tauri]|uniref:U1 small nuclear ribonucleoprotein C n=1 Tax=Ostreococcus tauri TaxID=70448 RepID=Q01EB2_OSTTA|nr:U1 small nuclear ribonucleoprotein C [Ostreococcus tauri]CAL52341.2 U1 small nuclear ribonucleoprotein C [Ostreococcus tauri]|eukprot:XP_003075069.1 U1 small nuclear ribonucleoprotein C [Ostreococcus tauri]
MARYYCDYCDAFLTHDSATVRKQHNSGFKHKANARAYYAQFQLIPQPAIRANMAQVDHIHFKESRD